MNDDHRFSRLELLIGAEALARLAGASVAVFGVGGVGSYAVEALARGGVGRLTLIDYDKVMTSNINRQLHALEGSIGHPKVQLMAERCRAINPAIEVEPLQACYQAETSAELLGRGYDYVLDCIDTISAKLHLIASCRERGLPIIAAMGAANKLDPAKVAVADLFTTEKCRLARIIRKELRRRGIRDGVKVVYSTEEYRLLPGSPTGKGDGRGTPDHAPLTLGSCSYLPPIFGLTMAGEVLRTLQGDIPR
jgi:tRNA A37 threonylcarbamoyladenosine dehydratase